MMWLKIRIEKKNSSSTKENFALDVRKTSDIQVLFGWPYRLVQLQTVVFT